MHTEHVLDAFSPNIFLYFKNGTLNIWIQIIATSTPQPAKMIAVSSSW